MAITRLSPIVSVDVVYHEVNLPDLINNSFVTGIHTVNTRNLAVYLCIVKIITKRFGHICGYPSIMGSTSPYLSLSDDETDTTCIPSALLP